MLCCAVLRHVFCQRNSSSEKNRAYITLSSRNTLCLYAVCVCVYACVPAEVGHTVGLQHDGLMDASGTTTTNYYTGAGNWGPIMGSSSGRTWTQFDKVCVCACLLAVYILLNCCIWPQVAAACLHTMSVLSQQLTACHVNTASFASHHVPFHPGQCSHSHLHVAVLPLSSVQHAGRISFSKQPPG